MGAFTPIWIVVVYYESKPAVYPFSRLIDAKRCYDDRCLNWSDVYLTMVMRAPADSAKVAGIREDIQTVVSWVTSETELETITPAAARVASTLRHLES